MQCERISDSGDDHDEVVLDFKTLDMDEELRLKRFGMNYFYSMRQNQLHHHNHNQIVSEGELLLARPPVLPLPDTVCFRRLGKSVVVVSLWEFRDR